MRRKFARVSGFVLANPELKYVVTLGLCLALAAGCKQFGRPDDKTITTDIQAKMFSDPNLKSANVSVSVKDGTVTLSGQVPDDSARLAAYKIATEAKGVTKVNDQMTVQVAQTAPEPQSTESAATPAPSPAPERTSSRPRARRAPARTSEPVNSANAPSEAAASSPSPEPSPGADRAPEAAPAPQPRTITIPADTIVTVRTIDSIDSATNTIGQIFKASLDAPIVVDDQVVVPKDADAFLKLVSASSAGRLAGRSELTLELSSIVFQGRNYNVVTSDVKQSGASRGKRSAATIGGGAAVGALIGAIAGGGKGAAIGAAVGGGAGTGVQVFTKGQQVKIPSETRLDFTLQQPFDVTYFPGRTSRRHSSAPSSDQPPPQ
jgi:BON domain